MNSKLTMQQAAQFLGVSESYFFQLVKDGKISFRQDDLIEYQEKSDEKSRKALIKQAQELGLGYESVKLGAFWRR